MHDITHSNWFGGYYQDVRNQFATFAVDPESWLRVYPKEFDLPEDQKKAWFADRTGAIVGADTAKKYGWKVGQRVPIQGTIYRRPDGGPWEFTIDGIYDSKIKGADKTNLLFNYQFLRETIPEQSGFRDRYNWYVFTVADPDRAPQIAAKIDAMFANSPSETKTNTEKAFVSDWAKQVGDIGKIMMWIVGDGDVHHSARHREHHGAGDPGADQRARGAQDPWLRRRTHPEAGAARVDAYRHRRRRRSAWRSRTCFIIASAIRRTACCRPSTSRRGCRRGIALVLVLGLAAGFLPAWQASRLRIVDALRRN